MANEKMMDLGKAAGTAALYTAAGVGVSYIPGVMSQPRALAYGSVALAAVGAGLLATTAPNAASGLAAVSATQLVGALVAEYRAYKMKKDEEARLAALAALPASPPASNSVANPAGYVPYFAPSMGSRVETAVWF